MRENSPLGDHLWCGKTYHTVPGSRLYSIEIPTGLYTVLLRRMHVDSVDMSSQLPYTSELEVNVCVTVALLGWCDAWICQWGPDG